MPSGNVSLYLEFYKDKKKEYEYLKLYLIPGENKKNKETLDLANKILVQRQNEVSNHALGYVKDLKGANFLEYFELLIARHPDSNKNRWTSTLNYLRDYSKGRIMFADINKSWLTGFKNYLDTAKIIKRVGFLSQNTKASYFNTLKEALKHACEDKIISHNPAMGFKAFSLEESSREFLTLEELRKLNETECHIPILKKAFIFSALTGLRWSDINKMKWADLLDSSGGISYRFKQKKTKKPEFLPISRQAQSLLPERQKPQDKVFDGLKYSAWHNIRLIQWAVKAGITRHITFHCARHTFSTLQLTHGTDIYTLSKLLGHRALRSTQVYAKVIDQKKIDAVNNIPDL